MTDNMLDKLVEVAVQDAHPNEVTPPLSTDGRQCCDEWAQDRVEWLRTFHQQRREGLTGPAREATWAVVVNG
ncbi:MAG TPA: hypothetical protein VFN61_00635, partial [Acidimicrobiales bacterium]|nr:hypothetical protein [Acidimicrobiales bacterium]